MSEINNPTTYLGMGVFWQIYLISAGGVIAAEFTILTNFII
jgi:hypothetical protein